MRLSTLGENPALVEQPLSSGADKTHKWQISHFAIEPEMDADNRRARKPRQAREKWISDCVFGQETEQPRRRNGRDKIRRFDPAPVAQTRASDATTRSKLQRLDDRVRRDVAARALDNSLRPRAIKFAEPDPRIDESRIAAAREKCALQNFCQQFRRRRRGLVVQGRY